MARFLGTDLLVYVGGVAIAHTTSCTLNINNHLPAASSKDDTADNHLSGARYDWSIDFEGLADFAATYGVEGLADLIIDSANHDFTLKISTETTGHYYYSGTANLESFSWEGPDEEASAMSGTFLGKGTLTKTEIT